MNEQVLPFYRNVNNTFIYYVYLYYIRRQNKMKTKVITIRDDQEEWLKTHKFIKVSGLTQDKLDEVIRKFGKEKTI